MGVGAVGDCHGVVAWRATKGWAGTGSEGWGWGLAKCRRCVAGKRRYGGDVSKFFGFLLGVVVALVGPAVFGVLAADGGIELNAKEMALAYGIGALIFWVVLSYFSGAAAIGAALMFGAMIYTVHWIPNRMTNFLNDVPGVTTGMIEGVKQYTLNGVVPILAVISLVYAIQLIVRSVQRRRRERAEAERVQREQELAQAQQAARGARRTRLPPPYPVAGGEYQRCRRTGSVVFGNTSYDDLFDEEEPEPVRPRNQADEQTAMFATAGAESEPYADRIAHWRATTRLARSATGDGTRPGWFRRIATRPRWSRPRRPNTRQPRTRRTRTTPAHRRRTRSPCWLRSLTHKRRRSSRHRNPLPRATTPPTTRPSSPGFVERHNNTQYYGRTRSPRSRYCGGGCSGANSTSSGPSDRSRTGAARRPSRAPPRRGRYGGIRAGADGWSARGAESAQWARWRGRCYGVCWLDTSDSQQTTASGAAEVGEAASRVVVDLRRAGRQRAVLRPQSSLLCRQLLRLSPVRRPHRHGRSGGWHRHRRFGAGRWCAGPGARHGGGVPAAPCCCLLSLQHQAPAGGSQPAPACQRRPAGRPGSGAAGRSRGQGVGCRPHSGRLVAGTGRTGLGVRCGAAVSGADGWAGCGLRPGSSM